MLRGLATQGQLAFLMACDRGFSDRQIHCKLVGTWEKEEGELLFLGGFSGHLPTDMAQGVVLKGAVSGLEQVQVQTPPTRVAPGSY